ncbi:hypothetical protein E4U19_000232 [Claviceps sp. Clav32 group G5]|nr:hypothetical protein E4U19_000232 [Claviceps sp. Clav32 group G5]
MGRINSKTTSATIYYLHLPLGPPKPSTLASATIDPRAKRSSAPRRPASRPCCLSVQAQAAHRPPRSAHLQRHQAGHGMAGRLLASADLIIWNEVPIQHKYCSEAVHRMLVDLRGTDDDVIFWRRLRPDPAGRSTRLRGPDRERPPANPSSGRD